MRPDDLEFSISQYLDGTLAEQERTALEERLETDAAAQALLAEYRRLDEALCSIPLPGIRWDRLTQVISEAVAQAEEPAQSYRIDWRRLSVPLGLAASVLFAAGIAMHLYLSSGAGNFPLPRSSPAKVEIVTGPQADMPGGPVQSEVAIGPAKAVAGVPDLNRYADDTITRPSRVLVVASGTQSVDDTPILPY